MPYASLRTVLLEMSFSEESLPTAMPVDVMFARVLCITSLPPLLRLMPTSLVFMLLSKIVLLVEKEAVVDSSMPRLLSFKVLPTTVLSDELSSLTPT